MKDRYIFGNNCAYSADTKQTGLNNNVAVIGCTGSGKTYSVIIPCLLNTYDSNLVITDPKGELVDKFSPMLSSRGYDVKVINLNEPDKSQLCFDPLVYCENDEDITRLAESIMCSKPTSSSEKFWDFSSQLLAELFLRYTIEFLEKPTFADFMEVLLTTTVKETSVSSGASLSISPLLEKFADNNPRHPLTDCYHSLHEIAPRTLYSVLITLRSAVRTTFNSKITATFSKLNSFNIDEFINRKTALFIMSDGTSEGDGYYLNIIYGTLINKLMKKAHDYPEGRLPIPVHLIMDDFACGSCIKAFPRMISTFRSKGISSTIILQDESQLTSMYGSSCAKTIMNNNDTLVYLGGNDMETASDISRRLNVPLNEVLYMPADKVLVFRRGQKPIKTSRYPVFEDPEYIRSMSIKEHNRDCER